MELSSTLYSFVDITITYLHHVYTQMNDEEEERLTLIVLT